MRSPLNHLLSTLTDSQIESLIPVIEQGMELDKLTYIATRDEALRDRISDTCVFLSVLYFRRISSGNS